MKLLFRKIIGRLRHLERRTLHDPLLTVPEFSERISIEEQTRYGSESRSNQAIADALLFAVQYVVGASVEGEIAEFGCMTGRTGTVLAAAMASFRTPKQLHLFDSFEGLPETDNPVDRQSVHVQEGVWAPGTCKGISPAALRARCEQYLKPAQVHIHKGWFSDTVPPVSGMKFGLLHIDCDLYESTMDVLEPLFARGSVADGAAILFDDWNCNRASPERGERKAWQEIIRKYQVTASDRGAYGWAAHQFIVHHYNGMPSA